MANLGKKAFLILGHGTEDVVNFEERPILPDGYTLITIAECGIVTTTDEVCPITEAFSMEENRNIFMNPQKYKFQIESFMKGKGIHIYKSGNKYPNLSLQMFLDWPSDDSTNILKSGVYKFPIDANDFMIGNGTTFCDKLFKKVGPYKGYSKILPDDYDFEEQFRNSLIPTVDEVSEQIVSTRKQSDKLKKKLTIPLEKIFEKGGPGIYYYIICRSPKSVLSPRNLVNLNILPENTVTKLSPYLIKNWTSKINEIVPILENSRNIVPKWAKSNLNKTIKNYSRIKKVPQIRRMSIVQQEGMGRKTIKKKKINFKKRKY